jgi:L-cysteate sulfo-lyase
VSRTLISNREEIRNRLASFPRCPVSSGPTPLERMENLSREFGANLYIKREDMTGLAFGGNKARKLDFIMADAIRKGATSIVTWAGVQSNWCRQVAAAARKFNIKPVLLLFNREGLPSEIDGNLLLDHLLGADVHVTELSADQDMSDIDGLRPILDDIVEKERVAGRRPYVAPIGGSLTGGSMTEPLGAIAYVNAMVEILDQADALKLRIDYIVSASGSGSTHAGLITGAKLLSPDTRIIAISVGHSSDKMAYLVKQIALEALQVLGCDAQIGGHEVIVRDQYFGLGYGLLNPETVRAMRMVAEVEGILLDPVYSGKAMVGLLDLLDQGYFTRGKNIVFVHTGGTPALFPYREALLGTSRDALERSNLSVASTAG